MCFTVTTFRELSCLEIVIAYTAQQENPTFFTGLQGPAIACLAKQVNPTFFTGLQGAAVACTEKQVNPTFLRVFRVLPLHAQKSK